MAIYYPEELWFLPCFTCVLRPTSLFRSTNNFRRVKLVRWICGSKGTFLQYDFCSKESVAERRRIACSSVNLTWYVRFSLGLCGASHLRHAAIPQCPMPCQTHTIQSSPWALPGSRLSLRVLAVPTKPSISRGRKLTLLSVWRGASTPLPVASEPCLNPVLWPSVDRVDKPKTTTLMTKSLTPPVEYKVQPQSKTATSTTRPNHFPAIPRPRSHDCGRGC